MTDVHWIRVWCSVDSFSQDMIEKRIDMMNIIKQQDKTIDQVVIAELFAKLPYVSKVEVIQQMSHDGIIIRNLK